MDSDESGHSESEFYISEEETFNQMTPINRDEEDIQKKKINMLFTGLGQSLLKASGTAFFPIRTSRPVNNMYLHKTREAWWPRSQCARLRIERSGFETWPGTLRCVHGQDT